MGHGGPSFCATQLDAYDGKADWDENQMLIRNVAATALAGGDLSLYQSKPDANNDMMRFTLAGSYTARSFHTWNTGC